MLPGLFSQPSQWRARQGPSMPPEAVKEFSDDDRQQATPKAKSVSKPVAGEKKRPKQKASPKKNLRRR